MPSVPDLSAVRRSWVVGLAVAMSVACGPTPPPDRIRVSGYVEATDVQVAPDVGGRLLELGVEEGDRVTAGQVVARLDTRDLELQLRRLRAERDQAQAQLRLIAAGARAEEVRQARAQVRGADEEVQAARAEVASATSDLERFEALLRSHAGSVKQRDDAATRREVAEARLRAAEARAAAAREVLARLEAGARREELDAARARVAAVDAQIAVVEKSLADATVTAPATGVVTTRLAEPGELVAPRTPILVITDLDHVWANVYVDEPLVPRVRVGQPAVILTDAGQRLDGTVTYVSPRAEFTPRNVQTADERAKLVYRLKVRVDNRAGVLKPGMPVEAELALARP